jgi:transcriptional regulator with PAS, ATPase and Fis domain
VGGTADIRTDVRIVAATNVDLHQAVRQGTFREDLYYRLAVLSVNMPPLREREGDVKLLLAYFIERFNDEFHKLIQNVAPAAVTALAVYPWPGNVRELRNAVERAVLLGEHPTLTKADFPMLDSPVRPESLTDFELPPTGIDFVGLERKMVKQALERARGNRTLAASLLGMNRDQIRYRIDKFGLKEYQNAKGSR